MRLLSSVCCDPAGMLPVAWNAAANGGAPSKYLLLQFHADRLNDAARAHGWAVGVTREQLEELCDQAVQGEHGACKVRILLSQNGECHASAAPLSRAPGLDPRPDLAPTSPSAIVAVVLDSQSTPSSILTTTKTTSRDHYDAARARAHLPPLGTAGPPRDVLLYNLAGEITETSICNIALFRFGRWLTPSASTGCLPGVMRRWLLEHRHIEEDAERVLTKEALIEGETALLFNAVQGCQIGRLHVRAPHQESA